MQFIRDTVSAWLSRHPARLAASIAYYAILSLGPLLLLTLLLASLFVGSDTARGQLSAELTSLMGVDAAHLLQSVLANAHQAPGGMAGSLAVVMLVMGSAGVWSEVSDALNLVWDVTPVAGGWKALLRQKLLGVLMVVMVGVLLVAAVLMQAMVSFFSSVRPVPPVLLQAGNLILPFVILTLLFATIYRVLPATPIPWSDVWVGAAVTSFLFTLGKMAIGLYLGRYTPTTVYGPAGGILATLLFVYYSAQVFLFGAEFTHMYARKNGSRSALASAPGEEVRLQQPNVEQDPVGNVGRT